MYNFSYNSLYSPTTTKPSFTVCLFTLSLISTACNLAITILSLKLLAIAFGNEQFFSELKLLSAGSKMLDGFETQNRIIISIVCLFMIILLKNTVKYISIAVENRQTRALVYRLKIKVIEILAKVNLDYYHRHKTENVLFKLNREIEQAALAVKSIQRILIISVMLAIMTIILFVISWQLTLVSLIILSSIIAVNNWFLAQANKVRVVSSKATQSSNRKIAEFFGGIRLIRAVDNEAEASKAIAKSLEEKDRVQFVAQLVSAAAKPVTEIGAAVLVLITIVSYYLYAGAISTIAPILLVYLTILFWLLPFLSQFSIAREQYVNTLPSVEVVSNFLATENKAIAQRGNLVLAELTKGITFKTVTFTYPDREQIILEKVDLEIPAKKTTALIGLQPTSNSAIADLLSRFCHPIEGTILLDDRELAAYSSNLSKAIAVVSHNTFLFNNSLAYNITYGIDDAAEAEIIAAAKKAQIYQFIVQLPAGLATEVGEKGISLSKLQKLQISLARAFLRNPKIIILDEPLSNLEHNLITVESIQKIIQLLCRDRTTIIITQQLELAKSADSIVVFRKGKIVETGTHHQLLLQGNIYPRLHSVQFKTNQQSHQLKLAQKIARKLAQRNNNSLAREIRTNLNALLTSLEILNQGWFNNDTQEGIILDESFQSAKKMLASLKKYERKLSQKNDETNY